MNQQTPSGPSRETQRILILGGGYVGLYAALRLKKKLRRGEAQVTIVDPRSYMTYQPFLPEAAAGSIEPRHVVVPLRRELRGFKVINGRVSGIRHGARTVQVTPQVGEPFSLPYDQLVVALGSVARTLPVPGLEEVGIGFKQVEEAVALRNHVLDHLDFASSVDDPVRRARALTFVFVGGGYAGTEAIAELEDMARYATSYYDNLRESDLRFVLVEGAGRILPEVREELGEYTLGELRSRGIDVRLETRMESCVGGEVVLSDGTAISADTIVWTAGVAANSPCVTPTCRWTTAGAFDAAPPCKSWETRVSSVPCGEPVIAPPYRTSPGSRVRCAHPVRNMPCAKHGCWATTSSRLSVTTS